jgi:hypothetical protein
MANDKDVVKLLKTRRQNEIQRELDSVLTDIDKTLKGLWPHLSSIAELLKRLGYPTSCGPLTSEIIKLYSGEEKAVWKLTSITDSWSSYGWHIREDGSLWRRTSSCNCCWVFYRQYFGDECARIEEVARTSVLANPEEGKLSSCRWVRHELEELLRAVAEAQEALNRLVEAKAHGRRLNKLRQQAKQATNELKASGERNEVCLKQLMPLLKSFGYPRFVGDMDLVELPGGSYGWQLERFDWAGWYEAPSDEREPNPPIGSFWYITGSDGEDLVRVNWWDAPIAARVSYIDYCKGRQAEVNQAKQGTEDWFQAAIGYCEEMKAVFSLVEQRCKELGGC